MADQVVSEIPASAFEALCNQVWLMRDAQRRVVRDGTVVGDSRGNAGEHPAIKVEREAANEVRRWLERYAVRSKGKGGGSGSDPAKPEEPDFGFTLDS